MSTRRFELPDGRGVVIFSEYVLTHIYQYAQTTIWTKEAGGQLFSATPSEAIVEISVVTGPHKTDKRTRASFHPDVKTATQDRITQFESGFHAVGLWHTHPEAWPIPSNVDRETTQAYLNAFNGEMEGFLLAILGNQGDPYHMTLWLASTNSSISWMQLPEIMYHVKDGLL